MLRISVLFLISVLTMSAHATEKLKIFAGITYGLHHLEDNTPKGTATEAIIALMDATGIPYEILMMNWAQAQKQTLATPDSLVFALARQPERENQYLWLVPLGKLDLKIAHLTSRPELEINHFDELKQYKIAAVRTLSTHQMLIKAGIDETEQLLLVDSSSRLLKVIEEGLVDFIFYEAAITPPIMKKFNYPADFLSPTKIEVPWKSLWLYLAANPDLSASVKQTIEQTHKRLMASDKRYQQTMKAILTSAN